MMTQAGADNAIAFDLTVADTEIYHPKGVEQVYAEVGVIYSATLESDL